MGNVKCRILYIYIYIPLITVLFRTSRCLHLVTDRLQMKQGRMKKNKKKWKTCVQKNGGVATTGQKQRKPHMETKVHAPHYRTVCTINISSTAEQERSQKQLTTKRTT